MHDYMAVFGIRVPHDIGIVLITVFGSICVALLGLVGVLAATRINWRIGKRTGDLAQQAASTSADQARIDKLLEENQQLRESEKSLRKEIDEIWRTLRELRREFDVAEGVHSDECERLRGKITGLEVDLERTRADLDRTKAERDLAVNGQVQAEGRLEGYIAGNRS